MKQPKCVAAVTIVEVMVAILILALAVVGAAAYRYYAVLDSRKATMHITAARFGLMLCESWRAAGGDKSYDPVAAHSGLDDLTIVPITYNELSAIKATTEPLGAYRLATDITDAANVNYYAVLSWSDISTDIRDLNVTVFWDDQDEGLNQDKLVNKSFRLATYVPIE